MTTFTSFPFLDDNGQISRSWFGDRTKVRISRSPIDIGDLKGFPNRIEYFVKRDDQYNFRLMGIIHGEGNIPRVLVRDVELRPTLFSMDKENAYFYGNIPVDERITIQYKDMIHKIDFRRSGVDDSLACQIIIEKSIEMACDLRLAASVVGTKGIIPTMIIGRYFGVLAKSHFEAMEGRLDKLWGCGANSGGAVHVLRYLVNRTLRAENDWAPEDLVEPMLNSVMKKLDGIHSAALYLKSLVTKIIL